MEDSFFDPPLPPTRFYRVEEDSGCPSLKEKGLSRAHWRTLTLLLMKLKFVAGDIEEDASGIRHIGLAKIVMLKDGTELAPLSVYFRMSAHGETARIIDVERILGSDEVRVSNVSLIELLGTLIG